MVYVNRIRYITDPDSFCGCLELKIQAPEFGMNYRDARVESGGKK